MNSLVMIDAKECRSCGVKLPEGASQSRCERCTTSEELLLSHLSPPPPVAPITSTEPVDERGTDFGDYVLLNEIARGGMGSVYRARQKSLNRIVALKRPLPGVAADEERVRRFRTEAEAVAALSHPNIIPVFECGEWNGEQFFSMGYIEGESLNEVLRQKTITPTRAAIYVRKIAEAIHHAHQRGVLHRDLKPANIIIDTSDEPRIADFGIARLLQGGDDDFSNAVVGTANYMAPEQIQPGNKPLSVATDVYALGGILYHLLTGKPPFEGQTRDQIFWSAYYEEPVSPARRNPEVPLDLEAICLKALEKNPDKRYASAQAMADDLERFAQRRPVAARPVPALIQLWMWIRRNPFIAALIMLLIGAIATATTLQLLAFSKVRTARAASEGIIGFMNGVLVHDLRDAGRLDLMEKVNARAEDYYTNYTAIADSGYWERKALFYENTAEVEKDMGELARAESRAVEAEAIYQRQQAEEPRELRWKRSQSRVRLLRLHIAKNSGLIPIANRHGATAVTFATEAMELAPTDATNRANLANVLLEQASFLIGLKRTETPSTNIIRAETILREVAALPSADPAWFVLLANCTYYRGLVRQLQHDPEGALAEFVDYLSMMQSLVRRFPQNTRWQFEQTVAYARVGEALFDLKQFKEAQSYVNVFEVSARNLTQIDPRNATWLSLYGRSLTWQGSLAKALHPTDTVARDYFRASLAVQSNLMVRNPDWDRWLDATAQTTFDLAGWHHAQAENEQAVAILAQWRAQCQGRAQNNPEHVGHQLRWGRAVVAETDLIRRIDGRERQLALLLDASAQFTAVPSAQPGVLAKAQVLAKLAEAYSGLGDPLRAADCLQDALELRLSFFEISPLVAKVREQISNNFAWTVAYRVESGDLGRAALLAENGLEWASKHLFPEEWRLDFAKMCWQLAQAVTESDSLLVETTRRIVARCLSERLSVPPALSSDEEALAESLRGWLNQHPRNASSFN